MKYFTFFLSIFPFVCRFSSGQSCVSVNVDRRKVKAFVTICQKPNDLSANISVRVNLARFNKREAGLGQDCRLDTLTYHVNSYWKLNAGSAIGPRACGKYLTNDHYDPTRACGPQSGNLACPSVQNLPWHVYKCSPRTYKRNPYVCEIGDYSGKFGPLRLENGEVNETFQDWMTAPLNKLLNRAIVFQCGNTGERAFCGRINAT